jgi:protein PhnA
MKNTYPDGDTVTLIKDLKVKNSSLVIKGGTKITNIRLVDGQSMLLKSEFMKKA